MSSTAEAGSASTPATTGMATPAPSLAAAAAESEEEFEVTTSPIQPNAKQLSAGINHPASTPVQSAASTGSSQSATVGATASTAPATTAPGPVASVLSKAPLKSPGAGVMTQPVPLRSVNGGPTKAKVVQQKAPSKRNQPPECLSKVKPWLLKNYKAAGSDARIHKNAIFRRFEAETPREGRPSVIDFGKCMKFVFSKVKQRNGVAGYFYEGIDIVTPYNHQPIPELTKEDKAKAASKGKKRKSEATSSGSVKSSKTATGKSYVIMLF